MFVLHLTLTLSTQTSVPWYFDTTYPSSTLANLHASRTKTIPTFDCSAKSVATCTRHLLTHWLACFKPLPNWPGSYTE